MTLLWPDTKKLIGSTKGVIMEGTIVELYCFVDEIRQSIFTSMRSIYLGTGSSDLYFRGSLLKNQGA
jgi:hypothetical protein